MQVHSDAVGNEQAQFPAHRQLTAPEGRVSSDLLTEEIDALLAALAASVLFLQECKTPLTSTQELNLIDSLVYAFRAYRMGGESVAA
jgi:hypothetical protein